jgi:hypothetical protein
MADKLLAARGGGQVGLNWPSNFVVRSSTASYLQAVDGVERALGEAQTNVCYSQSASLNLCRSQVTHLS